MLKITPLMPRARTEGGDAGTQSIIDYFLVSEYYLKAQGPDSPGVRLTQWHGQGLADLGIDPDSDVDEARMTALARGFAPDGTKLCQNAGEEPKWVVQKDKTGQPLLDRHGKVKGKWEGGHRVGVDCTWSADKSVSLLFAMADDHLREQIIKALHAARDEAFDYLSDKLETRLGGIKDRAVVKAPGLVAMSTTHFASRELDPQLHVHQLLFGVSKSETGRWGTHDIGGLHDHVFAAGGLFRSALGREMQKLGFGIEQRVDEKGHTYYGIAGISEEFCDHASKRRKQILSYVATHPGADAQMANLATRKHKHEPPFDELTHLWKKDVEQAQAQGIDVPTIGALRKQATAIVRKTDAEILETLHEGTAIFHRRDVLKQLAGMGLHTREELEAETDAFLERAGVQALKPQRQARGEELSSPGRRFTEARYCADWMLELERDTVQRAQNRKNETQHHLGVEAVEAVMEAYEKEHGFQLAPEQRDAVQWVTNQTGGTAIISGRAGTGKTTVSDVWVRAFKEQGFEVIGTAVGWKAAEKLAAEAGIPSHSTASLLSQLENGKLQLTPKTVLVYDESGMTGTRMLNSVQQYVDKSGAKLVLQGDVLQLQPIEAGAPMRALQEEVGHSELKDIRRQLKGSEEHAIANLFYADGKAERGRRSRAATRDYGLEILNRMDQNGLIDRLDTEPEARETLVGDYLADPTPMQDKLALTGTRKEAALLNEAIREGRKARGELRHEVAMKALQGNVQSQMKLAPGDLVLFTKKDKRLGVVRNDFGVVERIREGQYVGLDLEVRLLSEVKGKNGKVVRWNTEEDDFRELAHGYATTVHSSQGQGKHSVYHLMTSPQMLDQHMALVAFTRTKVDKTGGAYQAYGTHEGLERIHEKLALERLGANALEEGVVGPVSKAQLAAERPAPLLPTPTPQPTPAQTAAHRVARERLDQFKALLQKVNQSLRGPTPALQPEGPTPPVKARRGPDLPGRGM